MINLVGAYFIKKNINIMYLFGSVLKATIVVLRKMREATTVALGCCGFKRAYLAKYLRNSVTVKISHICFKFPTF